MNFLKVYHMVKQLSNGFKYILELNVPAELEYELTGKSTDHKRYQLSVPKISEEEIEALILLRAFWNNIHLVDNNWFVSTMSKSDSSGNVSTLKIVLPNYMF